MISPGSTRARYHRLFEPYEPVRAPVPVELLHNGELVCTYSPIGLPLKPAVAKVYHDRIEAWAKVGALAPGIWTARARDDRSISLRHIVPEPVTGGSRKRRGS